MTSKCFRYGTLRERVGERLLPELAKNFNLLLTLPGDRQLLDYLNLYGDLHCRRVKIQDIPPERLLVSSSK